MNVVSAAVGGVVPKLLQLLGDEYNLQRGVKKEVKSLSDELRYVHTFLCKVSEVPWDQLDEQVKEWASDIREASYDMEDILDTFLVRVEGREPTGRSRLKRALNEMANVFSFSKGKARHDVGCAIRDIMKQLREVAARRERYRIEDLAMNCAATTSTTDPRLKAMYNEVASLVGVDEPSEDLISKLSARADDMARSKKIVAVVGIGGLGKITLAKAVYDMIRADFECGAFVPVGRNPNLSKVLMDILYELDKDRFEDIHTKNRNERQLIDNLREFLGNKRYFIVIDDIWENKSWKEKIELALLDNNCGSRIIITTRNAQVAKEIGDEVYRMQPLSDDNSKKLFYTRTFGAKEKWPDNEPDEISEKILKKCDGIPLAIITMASLLVGKPRDKWSDVFTSVGFGHKDDKEVDNTMKILSFSYYDMPAYLRTCLLYLSVYPEDYMIDKGSLIWKWIAEGFIQGKPGIWLFELGEQYFNDLVNRSMIHPVEYYFEKGYRVHDMVLDLIRYISSEQNFVTVLDNDEGTVSPPPRTARRLALHGNTMEHTAHGNMKDDMPKVRSLIAFRCNFVNWVKLSSFKLLRVLDMEGCKNVRPPHLVHLENLLHLRYLGLEGTEIDELPNEIGALKLLQTLNLHKTQITQLTPSIGLLTQLVCLKGEFYCTLAPNSIGKLTSLEELQLVNIYFPNDNKEGHARGFLKALGSLRELRVLRCRVYNEMDESMQRDIMLSLCNLHKLRHLDITWIYDPDPTVWGEAGFVLSRHLRTLHLFYLNFSCLPPCIGAACLPYLTSLYLHVDAMDQKGLEFLGRLPELCYLYLHTKSTVTISNINASNSYFQKLRLCGMPESMIQFRCKEDLSVSFHVWNGIDAMPFGSSKNNCNRELYAVMPNLEKLECAVFVRALKDGKGDCGNIGLECLPSLWVVNVYLKCEGASAAEVDEAEAAQRKVTEVHPNRPMLSVFRHDKDKMISAVQDQKPKDDDVSTEEEDQKQQEGEPTADEGVTKSSILNS